MFRMTYKKNKRMEFKLVSDFKPTGDQPNAIKELVEGINSGTKDQVLLGLFLFDFNSGMWAGRHGTY